MAQELGAQLYTIREFAKTTAGIAESLKKVRALGYTTVQVSALGPIDKRDLRKLLDENGLRCVATHERWETYKNELPRIVEEHKILGCPHTAVGSMPNEYRSEEGYKQFAREASQVARELKKHDLSWSYHNHSFELVKFGKRSGLQILLEESDPEMGMEIDTYWIQHGGGDPADWIRKCKGRIPLVHFKDMVVQYTAEGTKQLMAEVGEGNLNWPAIIAACREAGVQQYLVEQDICQRDPFESLGISYRNLNALGFK